MRARRADFLVLAVVLGALLAGPLLAPPIWRRGEAREALVVRDIVRQGHWIIGYRDGALASKPPFFHWIAAAGATAAGLHDAVVRLPSAIGAFALLAATLALGSAIGGRRLGWLAATILAATPFFWRFASEARVDMVFAAAIAWSLVAFHRHDRDGSAAAGLGCLVALAAAILTKGPAGFVVPVLAMAGYLAIERRSPASLARHAWPLAGALALAAAWYAAAYAVAGSRFVEVQLLHENVARMVGTGAFHRRGGRMLHLPAAFATNLLPWNLVLIASLRRWWRGEREDAAGHLLHAWWMAVVVFFALASRTRTAYLLPAYPAIALLAARALDPLANRAVRAGVAVAAVLLLAVTQSQRIEAARRDPLPAFAARIRPHVGPATRLRAAPTLLENDALVLRWLLDRSIERGPLACERDLVVLAPPSSLDRATSLGLRVVARAGADDRAATLLDCPAAS